jgi:C-terminal peptidase prc
MRKKDRDTGVFVRWLSFWLGGAVFGVLLGACGVTSDLRLEPSASYLAADGKEAIRLRVVGTNALGAQVDVTSAAQLVIEGEGAEARDPKAWEERKLQIPKTGRFTIHAVYGELRSEAIQIEALDPTAYVHRKMHDIYYWLEHLPPTTPDAFTSPEDALAKMRYGSERGGPDRWSYLADLQAHNQFDQKGQYVGIGFNMAYDTQGRLRVSLAHPNSPAGRAGMKRSQILLAINGKTIQEIEEGKLWGSVFGKPEAGEPVEVTLQDSEEAAPRDIRFVRGDIQVRSVFTTAILPQGEQKIGYLLFNQFIEPSNQELDEAFAEFAKEGVNELVLDLRYNGGGRLGTALHLASLLIGEEHKEKPFFQYLHNSKHKDWDEPVPFQKDTKAPLALKRLVVIAMGATASASEVLINGLRPFLPITVIGRKTHGKPMGMYVYHFFDKAFAPISFKLANAEGKAEFFDGIPPDVEAIDDITRPFGDPQEEPLRMALAILSGKTPSIHFPLRIAPRPAPSLPQGLPQLIGTW